MKRLIRRCLRGLACCLILLGLLGALAFFFAPNRYYRYHVIEATATQAERYAYADSHSIHLGVVNGYVGGFYWEKQVGRAGGPAKVLSNGWFPDNRPLKLGEMAGMPFDLTANGTGNRINLTIAESKFLGNHPVTHSLLLPLWLCSLICLIAGAAVLLRCKKGKISVAFSVRVQPGLVERCLQPAH